jgi:hypothetical protein
MNTSPSYAGLEALHRTRAMWAAREAQRQRHSDARRKVWLHCVVAFFGTIMCMLLVHINVELFTALQGSTQFIVEFVDRFFQF